MLKNDELLYQDEYMYFTFDTIHSSNYNLIIQNDIDSLKMILDTGAKVNFASPQYQGTAHVLGVTYSQRTIPLKLIAHNITRKQVQEIGKWLRVGKQGQLFFDFARDWAYDVVVTSSADPTMYECEVDDFNVIWDIKFQTVGSPFAHSRTLAYYDSKDDNKNKTIYNTSTGVPAFEVGDDNKTVYIYQLGDKNSVFTISAKYGSEAEIQAQDIDGTDTQPSTNIDFSIEDDNGYKTTLKAIPDESNHSGPHYVDFNSETNGLFVENMPPEYAKIVAYVTKDNFQCEVGLSPMYLGDGRGLIEINTDYIENEETYLQQLLQMENDYGINWFICKPAQIILDNNSQSYTNSNCYAYTINSFADIKRQPIKWVKYDENGQIIRDNNGDIIFYDVTENEVEPYIDWGEQTWSDYIYFGLYHSFKFDTNDAPYRISVKQYTEAI